MRVLVLGAGALGVTTAYILHKRGHEVEVVERNAASALECSFANGGQLSYNHAEPWASPAGLKNAIRWLARKDAPLLFRLRAEPSQWAWVLRFLTQCTQSAANHNTETLLRLGLYSRQVMHRITDDVKLDFDYQKNGKIFIFETQQQFDAARRQSDLQLKLGGKYQILTPDQCVGLEPALTFRKPRIIGGIVDGEDECGDIFKFTQGLAAYLEKQGVRFHYGTEVKRIQHENYHRITGIETSRGTFAADSYVMALGCYSPIFLKKLGISVPIYPLKGYSISINAKGARADAAPQVSVSHMAQKIVFSRLGDILRVAGTAEFAGYNDKVRKPRIDMLKAQTRDIFPECGDIDGASEWACLRPMTPDGPPILGATPVHNLYLNTGHGSLGWTQGAGSAAIVADIMEGKTPEIDLKGLLLKRYV